MRGIKKRPVSKSQKIIPLTIKGVRDSIKKSDRLTIHHRKPKNIKGRNSPYNRSKIPLSKHRAWHILVGTRDGYEVILCLDFFFEIFGEGLIKSNHQRRIIRDWVGDSQKRKNIHLAWNTLFNDLSCIEISRDVNTLYIDPDFT